MPKEPIAGVTSDVEFPLGVTKSAVIGARTALDLLNQHQSTAALKAWQPLERSSALRSAELARSVLGNFGTSKLVAPLVEELTNTTMAPSTTASAPSSPPLCRRLR